MAGSHDGIPWALPSVLQCAEGKGREHDPEKACPGFEPGVETGFPKMHAPLAPMAFSMRCGRSQARYRPCARGAGHRFFQETARFIQDKHLPEV
jgi:hypothetical protein